MPNMLRGGANLKWTPDASAVGAPDGALLRGDNLVSDRVGSLTMRAGSQLVYSGLADQRVVSMYTATLNGTAYTMAGVDNHIYSNGAQLGADFEGSGDIVFGDDSYQLFSTRGSTGRKWDGTHLYNWSIAAPVLAATVAAVDAPTATAASFDTAESPAFTVNEGTKAFVANYAGTAASAMSITPDATTGKASVSKTFAAAVNYADIGGAPGGGTDLFDMRVWLQDWRKVEKITIMFGMGTGADPFLNDYYYFDFNVNAQDTVNIKDASSQAASAYAAVSAKSASILTMEEVTNVRSAAEAGTILRRLGRYAGPRSTERRDSQQASPAWGHFSVTKGQFNRVGGTTGCSWATITAFKVVYTVVAPGHTPVIYLDDAIWTGGGARSLTGTFKIGYRFARRFEIDNKLVYYELSPMSPISSEITLNQQTLQVTVPATALTSRDEQATEVWAYIQGGWLDTYYRFAILPATPQTGMTIDEVSAPQGSDFDTAGERARLVSWGMNAGQQTPSSDVVFTGGLSEVDILIENEPYTPGTMNLPDNIVAIAGPWNGRMFVLDSDGFLHPSSSKYPSSFSAFHAIDLRRYGTPLWLAATAGGIVAGFSKDIIPIAGSGDESADRVIIDLWGDPMSIGNPPIDSAVVVNGNTIMYRSADGLMGVSGSTITPIPTAGTSLLWKGEDRHGVSALNTATGRFRMAMDNYILYCLMPEGTNTDPTSIWQYDLNRQQWSRHVYPFTPLSIVKEPSGRLLTGSDSGDIHEIETGNSDLGVGVAIYALTPVDYGGYPLQRKDAADFQIHVDTGGAVGSISFMKDGSSTAAKTISFDSTFSTVHRTDVTGLGTFLSAQMSISGTFTKFSLFAHNLTYRLRPQQTMALDLGYVIPQKSDIAWLTEAEVDVVSPVDLSLLVYKDDVLFDTRPVPVSANRRSVYRVPLLQGTKARRLRLKLITTNAAGSNNPGFEPYSVKVRHHSSGNLTELLQSAGDFTS